MDEERAEAPGTHQKDSDRRDRSVQEGDGAHDRGDQTAPEIVAVRIAGGNEYPARANEREGARVDREVSFQRGRHHMDSTRDGIGSFWMIV